MQALQFRIAQGISAKSVFPWSEKDTSHVVCTVNRGNLEHVTICATLTKNTQLTDCSTKFIYV